MFPAHQIKISCRKFLCRHIQRGCFFLPPPSAEIAAQDEAHANSHHYIYLELLFFRSRTRRRPANPHATTPSQSFRNVPTATTVHSKRQSVKYPSADFACSSPVNQLRSVLPQNFKSLENTSASPIDPLLRSLTVHSSANFGTLMRLSSFAPTLLLTRRRYGLLIKEIPLMHH